MTRKKKNKQEHKRGVVVPAPMLFKRSVPLTDAFELFSSSILGSGFGQVQVSANGANLPSAATIRVPQARIWDQYAAMFEFYQVKRVHLKFIPYKWEYPGGAIAVQTTGYPVWSIIDPENTLPGTLLPSSYYSYGNCKDTRPYDEHRRSMMNYTDLGLSKQDTLILPTNGSSASRSLYNTPATIGLLARAPTGAASGAPLGLVVWTVEYEFSGQRAPNVSISQPQAQICDTASQIDESEKLDRVESALAQLLAERK